MKHLFLGMFILAEGCTTQTYSLNTCDFKTISYREKHLLVKIIAVDSAVNQYASGKGKCFFYTAVNIDRNDTFNLIDIQPQLETTTVVYYTKNKYQLVFMPKASDTCFKCFYQKEVFYDKKNDFPFLAGRLQVLTH